MRIAPAKDLPAERRLAFVPASHRNPVGTHGLSASHRWSGCHPVMIARSTLGVSERAAKDLRSRMNDPRGSVTAGRDVSRHVESPVALASSVMRVWRGVPGMTDRPDILRERATRARLYARTLMLDAAGPPLLAYADELDALATAVEAGQPADYDQDHAPKH